MKGGDDYHPRTQLQNGLNAGIWPSPMLDRDLNETHIISSHDLGELDLALTFHICFKKIGEI